VAAAAAAATWPGTTIRPRTLPGRTALCCIFCLGSVRPAGASGRVHAEIAARHGNRYGEKVHYEYTRVYTAGYIPAAVLECTQLYCTYDWQKIMDVGTFSFRWIKTFLYFCVKKGYKASRAVYPVCKQKYQKGFIHRKLKVPTSEREGKPSNPRGRAANARCMEKSYGNLRNPARVSRAGAMQWFSAGHRYSSRIIITITIDSTTKFSSRCRDLSIDLDLFSTTAVNLQL
jgi:hypothetical protein